MASQERPVPGFVDDLVDRLVQQQGAQQHGVPLRVEAAGCGVARAERLGVAPHPVAGHRGQAVPLGMGDQLVPGRVVERAEHAGHVPQRRGAGPALRQRAGRLALEVEHHPAGLGPHHLAQVVVAVHPLGGHRLGQLGQAWSRRRRPCRRSRRSSGTAAMAMSSRRNICSASSRRASGSSSEMPNASARSACTCAVATPSRSASPAKSPPAGCRRRPCTGPPAAAVAAVQRVQVAHAGRGQRPAVGGGAQVAGQDRQHGGRAVDPGLDPAVRLRHVRRAELGQRRGHLQVRVRARRDPAEHLEDGRLAEHQAGVALLAGQHQAVQAALAAGGSPGGPRQVGPGDLAEAQRADGPVGHDRVQQRPGQVAVVQPVVDLPPVLRPDPGVPQPGGQPGAQADEQLVAVGGGAVRDGDDQVPQAGVAGDDLGVGHDREVMDGPPLAGEPSLLDQPRCQHVFESHDPGLPHPPRGIGDRPGATA